MKKIVLGLIGAAIVITAIIVVLNKQSDNKASNTASSTVTTSKTSASTTYKEVKACDVLTPAIAQQLAGPDATSSDTPEASTSSVSVTNCSYYSSSNKTSASLLSRSALDKAGADTNRGQFTTSLPDGAQKVGGYGDAAYWSPAYGQFNILKHNNWYILSLGPVDPKAHTLADNEKLASLIVDKL